MNTLVIDIGNTFTKVAYFEGEKLMGPQTFPTKNLENELGQYLSGLPLNISAIGWVSVVKELNIADWSLWQTQQSSLKFYPIKSTDTLPIKNQYATPGTLGPDRIMAVIGARRLAKNKGVLVIDAGTAITYDVADKEGNYWGGAIGPGLHMRFRALHEFTARLPMVKEVLNPILTGNSTETSIRSGVINGLCYEIEGMISGYKQAHGDDLQVFLTGGDMPYFENQLKNVNFADHYLILRGINYTIKQYS